MSDNSDDDLEPTKSVYRRVYFDVIDRILSELSKRFDHSGTILKAIAACSPKSSLFFDTEEIKPLAVQYGIDVDLLVPQLAVAKNLLQSKGVCNLEEKVTNAGVARSTWRKRSAP